MRLFRLIFEHRPYRNCDLIEDTDSQEEQQQKPFYVTDPIRLRRNHLLQSIQGDDIRMKGVVSKNHKLGNVPTRAEALAELEELLLSM